MLIKNMGIELFLISRVCLELKVAFLHVKGLLGVFLLKEK